MAGVEAAPGEPGQSSETDVDDQRDGNRCPEPTRVLTAYTARALGVCSPGGASHRFPLRRQPSGEGASTLLGAGPSGQAIVVLPAGRRSGLVSLGAYQTLFGIRVGASAVCIVLALVIRSRRGNRRGCVCRLQLELNTRRGSASHESAESPPPDWRRSSDSALAAIGHRSVLARQRGTAGIFP
jgi:hypothetical protein